MSNTYDVWQRCGKCHHQKHEVKQNGGPVTFGSDACEKCGHKGVDVVMGGKKPNWWVEGK